MMKQPCHFILLLGIILLIKIESSFSAVHDWGYHHGVHPEHWGDLFPTCNGKKQSPIDIKTDDVKCDPRLERFDLRRLAQVKNVRLLLENVGHAVQVDLKGKDLKVKGGSLPGTYIVEQFHFHWGTRDMRGTEHALNGKHYSMEMHVVMHSSEFDSVADAMNTTNGLAVLGFLVDVGRHNRKFEEIISHLKRIRHKDDSVLLDTFSLLSLFPKSTEYYYRYCGSLTTPPCYESVIWTIFKEHIHISEHQLNTFRRLGRTMFEGVDLINNYRPLQPLNGRIVRTNDKKGCDDHHWGHGDKGSYQDNCATYPHHFPKKYHESSNSDESSDSSSQHSESD